MEFGAQDQITWPLLFSGPTMNRASTAASSDANQLPWLIGIDGRSRGALEPFPGVGMYGYPPTSYNATITVTDYSLGAATTVTINGTNLLINLATAGSNNAAATNLASGIAAMNTALATTSAVGNVVTVVWKTGYGYGAFTWSFSSAALSGTPGNMTAVYAGDAATTIDAQAAKYLEIRLGSGSLLRGYLVQKTNGTINYYYKKGTGGDPFTDFITVATSTSAYKIGVAGGGRVAYIVGSDGAGSSIAKVITSKSSGFGQLLSVFDMGPSGDTSTIGAPAYKATTNTTGALDVGYYLFAYRYYDSIRRRYSAMSTPYLRGSYTANDRFEIANNGNVGAAWTTADPFKPLTTTKGPYDYVQVFSSISNGDGAVERGNYPLYARGTLALSNDYWTWSGAGKWGAVTVDDYYSDDSLVFLGQSWDPVGEYVNTTVPVLEDIAFVSDTNFGIEPSDEMLTIRWTPLNRAEPENFPPLNAKKTNIPAGGAAHFVMAGDYLWLLGEGESYRIQKRGGAIAIHRMLEGISVVGNNCSVAVGATIYTVTTQGILAINAETGDYQQIATADRMILKRWANNLTDASATSSVFAAYDSRLAVVTFLNKPCGEALQLWLTTSRVTMLVDMWFDFMFDGRIPNNPGKGVSTVLISELADGPLTRSTGGFFLQFNSVRPTNPNMMGLTSGLSNDLIGGLVGTPLAVALDGSNTKLTFIGSPWAQSLTGRGRFTGCVLYPLSNSTISGYKVIDSDQDAISYRHYLWLSGDQRSHFTTSTKVSIAPVVMAALGPPLPGFYNGDMLTRRLTKSVAAVLSQASSITTGTDNIFEYSLVRGNNAGDETVLDAVSGTPMNVAARSLPWTASYPVVKAGVGVTLDTSTPKALFAYYPADGGILYPGFRFCRSGDWVSVLGLFVLGNLNPNQQVESI